MSDRICVLYAGEVQQTGAPREVYEHPRTPFVAGFFGRSNTLQGTLQQLDQAVQVRLQDGSELSVSNIPAGLGNGAAVCVTLRRENLQLSPDKPEQTGNCFAGTLQLSSFAGNTTIHVVRLANGLELSAEKQAGRGRDGLSVGAQVYLSIDPEDIIVTAP
jgi:ABC-type Fe3+/spermidine/putrescine transport system ATPase subunit